MTTTDRSILPPPRSSVPGTTLVISSVILLSIVPFSLRANPWAAGLAVLLVVAAIHVKETQALYLAFFTALLSTLPFIHASLRHWPFNILVPLIFVVAVALLTRRYRKALSWLKTGTMEKEIVLLVIVTAVISGVALYLWYRLLTPDLSVHLGHLPAAPRVFLPFIGIAFALGNAALEESAFRGIVMQATDSALGTGWLSVFIQSVPFGAMHYLQGFPNGWWGLAMTLVYGVMLGVIRRRSQGMLAPWLAHACADMVIFVVVATVATGKQAAL